MTPSISIDAASVRELSLLADVSRRLVMDGRIVDLRSLSERVEALCGGLARQPAGHGPELRTALIGLMDELARLEAAVRRSQADAAGRLREIATLRRAVSAYGAPQPEDEAGRKRGGAR